jgi:hypothetical protein
MQQNLPQNAAPIYSNIIKRYANWNVCYHADLMLRMGIRPKHALYPGDIPIIKRALKEQMQINIQRDTTHVPRLCTRTSCLIIDKVGQIR